MTDGAELAGAAWGADVIAYAVRLEKLVTMAARLMDAGDAATAGRVIRLAADIAEARDLSGEMEAADERVAAGPLH
jgi:hypothetical protein